jgi:uncharacterized protein YdeI (YjbR/CyaY-like superfamily)
MSDDTPVLAVANASAWSQWLAERQQSEGVWLLLAKKGTVEPTRLTYDEALEEAIRYGWIDGRLGKVDDRTFRRRFSPRRPGSAWSKRNLRSLSVSSQKAEWCPPEWLLSNVPRRTEAGGEPMRANEQ